MSATDIDIKDFATRVRQLILQLKENQKDMAELRADIEKRDKRIAELEEQLNAQKTSYETLMGAKMLNVTDGDIEKSRKRIASLIRTVNQCITLLSEQQ